MDANAPGGLLRWFSDLQDPRPGHNVMHLLSDMLAIAILGVICGAEGWAELATFARCKEPWLRTFLPLPHGIPSHDTFGRVFAAILPEQFEQCFLKWTAHLATHKSRLVAIDGKTLRRSFDSASGKEAIHMISAWCQENRLVLGQLATEAKSNEIKAIPKLLTLLDLKGAVVTIDAMGCQKSIAKAIIDGGGDYVLQVKENQHALHESLKLLFAEGLRDDCQGIRYATAQDIDKDHGRLETRRCWSSWDIGAMVDPKEWKGLRSVACVERVRETPTGTSTQRHYYISSLGGRDAQEMLGWIRGHWSIENSLHWRLDVQMNEDASRIRKGHSAENFSRLRRGALNALKRNTTHKVGLKTKSKACSWDHDYLLAVLTG
jgi:predicted transposase YbfD/YdcC